MIFAIYISLIVEALRFSYAPHIQKTPIPVFLVVIPLHSHLKTFPLLGARLLRPKVSFIVGQELQIRVNEQIQYLLC